MKFFIKIFTITICLVVLLLPFQNVMGQDTGEMDCCKTETSKDCCNKDAQKETSKKHKDCGDCCTTAHTCSGCYGFLFPNSGEGLSSSIEQIQLKNFPYTTPFFQSLADSIWQPPKLV